MISGKKYFFAPNGSMQTGWVKRPEGWYYASSSGAMETGWKYLGSSWYYLDRANQEYSGLMVSSGEKVIGKYTYAFKPNGEMKTGWDYVSGSWYYYDASGAKASGWRAENGKWYYLDYEKSGLMLAGCSKVIGGKEYSFKSNGEMKTGWDYVSGSWYYYNASGAKASGWCEVNGKWYYLDGASGGRMLANQWKKSGNGKYYYLHSNGEMAVNWLYLGGQWYYCAGDGAMRFGWQQIDGEWYYLYKENDPHGGSRGVMAKNTTIDGYKLDSSGRWMQEYHYAEHVLNQVGWSLWSAYNWSAGLTYQTMTSNSSPGSAWFATYGFQNGRGNCYVMAATFCYLARTLGYEAHQISGYVPLRNGGRSPHSWCEVVVNGTTYVFDPNFTNETGRNGYQINYGTSGTWRYVKVSQMN